MPIAAKFSETFYQRFGHEATGELVDYLNTVDRAYRSELRDLNDINWSRFESRMDARFEQFWTRVDARFARVDARFEQVDARLEQRLAELKAELLKWMFLFWVGTVGTLIALRGL